MSIFVFLWGGRPSRRGGLLEGQLDGEGGPGPGCCRPEGSRRARHDVLTDGQPQSGALFLGSEIGLKDIGRHLRGSPTPVSRR